MSTAYWWTDKVTGQNSGTVKGVISRMGCCRKLY